MNNDRPRRKVTIDLRTLQKLSKKDIQKLCDLAEIASVCETDIDLTPVEEPVEHDTKSEAVVLEAAAEQLGEANAGGPPKDADSTSLSPQHVDIYKTELANELEARQSIDDLGKATRNAGIGATISVFIQEVINSFRGGGG